MTRAQVRVREASDADLDLLPQWWESMRAGAARSGPFAPPVLDDRLRERVAELHRDDRHRLLVAECGGEPVGLAVLSREPVSPISDAEAVAIDVLHVRDDHRRQGAGRALVAAAADYAAGVGADFVTVAAQPQARDTNRFFARLGFGPIVVRRAVATPVLQRRLAGRSGAVRHLVARRRLAGQRVVQRLST